MSSSLIIIPYIHFLLLILWRVVVVEAGVCPSVIMQRHNLIKKLMECKMKASAKPLPGEAAICTPSTRTFITQKQLYQLLGAL